MTIPSASHFKAFDHRQLLFDFFGIDTSIPDGKNQLPTKVVLQTEAHVELLVVSCIPRHNTPHFFSRVSDLVIELDGAEFNSLELLQYLILPIPVTTIHLGGSGWYDTMGFTALRALAKAFPLVTSVHLLRGSAWIPFSWEALSVILQPFANLRRVISPPGSALPPRRHFADYMPVASITHVEELDMPFSASMWYTIPTLFLFNQLKVLKTSINALSDLLVLALAMRECSSTLTDLTVRVGGGTKIRPDQKSLLDLGCLSALQRLNIHVEAPAGNQAAMMLMEKVVDGARSKQLREARYAFDTNTDSASVVSSTPSLETKKRVSSGTDNAHRCEDPNLNRPFTPLLRRSSSS
jgi:hypothetical protein